MAKKNDIKSLNSFFNWSAEEQARFIEKETANVIKRLPHLKSALQMYNEVSDELYNMTNEELQLMGSTYAQAIRNNEITTPSSKHAYKVFIDALKKYSRQNIKQLAGETAQKRIESWLEHIKANGSLAEIQYATQLINSMTESEIIGFTRSKYFLDVDNWNSEGFVKETDEGEYSIQTLKLELYLKQYGENRTDDIYEKYVAVEKSSKLRGYARGKKGRKR